MPFTGHGLGGLARSVREVGWKAGVESWQEEIVEEDYYRSRCDLSMRQTAWKAFFDPRWRGSILVIDRGLGSALVSLAGDFERVIALFTEAGLMQLAQTRVSSLGIRNVEFLLVHRLEAASLPCESLDAAGFYGVPGSELTASVCSRLGAWLRPHATAYFGAPRVGFQALLPGVVRRLRQHFASVHAFRYDAPLNAGYELLPLRRRAARPRTRLANLLAPFRAPAFGIVAAKTPQPLFGPVLDAVANDLRIERFLLSYPFGFSLIASEKATGRRVLIKMPLDAAAIVRAEANYRILHTLAQRNSVSGEPFPKPVLHGDANGQRFFVEEVLRGRPILKSDLTGPRGFEIQTNALNWLTEFHRSTAQRRDLRGPLLDRLVLLPIDRACRLLKADRDLLAAVRDNLALLFSGRTLNLVFSHGDYTSDNILLDGSGNRVRGVFDWDMAQEPGLPLLDALYFLVAAERDCTRAPYGEIFARLFRRELSPRLRKCIEGYCSDLDIPSDLYLPLAIMSWVRHLTERMYMAEPGRFPHKLWKEALEALSPITAGPQAAMHIWQK